MRPIAPPFPNETAFFCRFFKDIGSYRDEDNRPLHEVDFRAEQSADSYSTCPFRDSREGYLINRAALHQIAAKWKDVLAGLQFFTSLSEGRHKECVLGLGRAWHVSLAVMFSPIYLFHRAKQPLADGGLPVEIAGLFKILLDVPTTIDLMFMKSPSDDFQDPKAIQRFADNYLILLNGEYACAGPPTLIDEVIELLYDKPDIALDNPFRRFFPDVPEFLEFVDHMTRQYVVAIYYQLATMFAMECAFGELSRLGLYTPLVIRDDHKFSAYERRRRIALSAMTNSDMRETALTAFAQQIKEESHRSFSAESFEISQALLQSQQFLREVSHLSPREILVAHREYQVQVGHFLRSCRRNIEDSIGAQGLFDEQMIAERLDCPPAQQLAEILDSFR